MHSFPHATFIRSRPLTPSMFTASSLLTAHTLDTHHCPCTCYAPPPTMYVSLFITRFKSRHFTPLTYGTCVKLTFHVQSCISYCHIIRLSTPSTSGVRHLAHTLDIHTPARGIYIRRITCSPLSFARLHPSTHVLDIRSFPQLPFTLTTKKKSILRVVLCAVPDRFTTAASSCPGCLHQRIKGWRD